VFPNLQNCIMPQYEETKLCHFDFCQQMWCCVDMIEQYNLSKQDINFAIKFLIPVSRLTLL
jgi:hypothetical protein